MSLNSWSRAALCAAALSLTATTPALAQDERNFDEPDPIVELSADDPALAAAQVQAKENLINWLAVLAEPPAGTSNVAFKFPLEGWEHIWVENVTRDGEFLHGTLSNVPHSEGWSWGDFVRVPITDVSDWAYRDADGVMQGHFTTRALFAQLDMELVDQIKADFRWE